MFDKGIRHHTSILTFFVIPGECGSHITKFLLKNEHSSSYPAERMYCDSTTESKDSNGYRIWLTKNKHKGQGFIAQLATSMPVIGIKLRNIYESGSRSLKKFRVSITNNWQYEIGPFTELLTQELEDSRKQRPPPLQEFKWVHPVMGRFIKFEILEYWGRNGGGLNYFDIIPAPSGL